MAQMAWLLLRVYWFIVRPKTLGARVIAQDAEGRIALVRHRYGAREWIFPGGGVKRGEVLIDAGRRELLEETGLASSAKPRLLGIYSNFEFHVSNHIALFVMEDVAGAARSSWEIQESGLFALDALPTPLAAGVSARLAEWQGRSPISETW